MKLEWEGKDRGREEGLHVGPTNGNLDGNHDLVEWPKNIILGSNS